MNTRTLIITAGAIVALAAPTVANARMLPVKQPSKHVVKKHTTKPGTTKPGTKIGQGWRGIYIYVPAPPIQAATSLEQIQQDYNDDLIAHGLDPIDFGSSTPAAAPETPSSDVTSEAPSTDVAPQASDASLAAAASTTASETAAGTGWDDLYLDC